MRFTAQAITLSISLSMSGDSPTFEIPDLDEVDPTHEVGPSDCEGVPIETEVKVQKMGEQIEESEVSFLHEIDEGYEPRTQNFGIGGDGLPIPLEESGNLAIAAAFTYENMVCIEDTRSFVELFREEIYDNYLENKAEYKLMNRSRYDDNGTEVPRLEFDPDRVEKFFGNFIVHEKGILIVRPIRERCVHYKRQIFINDEQPDPNEPGNKIVFRNCSVRRTVGGAALSLRDEAVFACDWRNPRDPASEEKWLDAFDRKKLQDEPGKIRLPLFGNRE